MNFRTHPAIKAFVVYEGKVLLLRESINYEDGTNEGKFDVVGGRVKPGQRFDDSLIREIKEETDLEVVLGEPFHIDEWRPTIRGEQWQIVGTFVECFAKSNQVQLSRDHYEYIWVNPEDYREYDLIDSLNQAFEIYLGRISD